MLKIIVFLGEGNEIKLSHRLFPPIPKKVLKVKISSAASKE